MLARVFSCTTVGMDPSLVEVEVDVTGGLPCFEIVGLPSATVKESKERVRAAIKNSGFEFPPRRIIVNLAPADIKKEGSGFDLAVAVGILAATGQLEDCMLDGYVMAGELSLDGRLRGIAGVLPMALFLGDNTQKIFLVPQENSKEAGLTGVCAYSFDSLAGVIKFLHNPDGSLPVERFNITDFLGQNRKPAHELGEVKGQAIAKRALEVAAAGGHNILFIGPPGSGKSMLARCLPSIMPPLTEKEALEISKIYSIAGLLTREMPLVVERPFRSPHHSTSLASMVGGGHVPRPGEISLAGHGVLFLDELPEFRRDVLEALRQPLEENKVTISRVATTMAYPAHFQLVAAANPCYCGYYGDKTNACTCTPYQIAKYRNRLSGPLLDRIDIHVEVPRLSYQELEAHNRVESDDEIRARVIEARARQLGRYQGSVTFCNARMSAREMKTFCHLDTDAKRLLKKAFLALGLSARAHGRILKVARTIADLDGREHIRPSHIAEAIQYRSTMV